jgi:hypothetical protein
MAAMVALIVVVAGQRLVVPVGPWAVPVPLLAGYCLLLVLYRAGALRYSRVRLELFLAATGCVLACAWLSGLRGPGSDSSVTSVLMLLVTYLPWVFCSPRSPRLYRLSVRIMCAASVAALAQVGYQWITGRAYSDPLRVLPAALVNGSYNTANPIRYGSELLKPNAGLFLEPSFLSQFLALAVILALVVRAPVWQPFLLGLGLVSTLSGTGLVLLAFGVLAALLTAPGCLRWSHVAAGLTGIALVLSTPAAGLLLERRSETARPGTSGYARFVQPYTETARGLADSPGRYVVGAGPGSSDRLLESPRSGGAPVVYPVLPKLAFEYGLASALLVSAFLLTALLRGAPSPALASSLGVMVFLLSGSLLQPHTTMLAWLLGALSTREQHPGQRPGEELGERQAVGSAGRA